MKIKLLVFLSFFLIGYAILAQANLSWAKSMGGLKNDEATSLTVDPFGNVYTIGIFEDSCDFDPSTTCYTLFASGPSTSLEGPKSMYISKLDGFGNFVWAKTIGNMYLSPDCGIASNINGDIYMSGNFQGTVDFDPGIGTYNLSSISSSDVFILKLDSSGNFLWAKQLGGTFTIQSNSIDVDLDGNVYTTGPFQGIIDFDPGAGVFNITSTGPTGYGHNDIFISKLNSAGDFVWAKSMLGTNNDVAYAITTDNHGNVYTTGTFQNTVDFDPGVPVFNLSALGSGDIFVSKLDSTGFFVWAKQFSGSYSESHSITVDESGNVYTSGFFGGTTDFDPSISIYNLTSVGPYYGDVFISKLNASGDFVWVKQLGGTAWDYVTSIKVDTLGNVYTLGYFYGSSDYDPGTSVYTITPAGSCDIFLIKLNTSGNFVWVKQFGGASPEIAYSLDIDELNNLYMTGWFQYTVDFDPGMLVYNLTSESIWYTDVFVLKIHQELTTSVDIDNINVATANALIDPLTNIHHSSFDNEFFIFPNPNVGTFSIQSETVITKIEVVNILGEIIYSKEVNSKKDFVDLSSQTNGIYFVQLFSEERVAIEKISISK